MTIERDAAIAYADRGLAVFQLHQIRADGRCGCGDRDCDNVGKHPVSTGWQRSVPSVQFAGREWSRFPNRGIGLACGPRSGCFGLDIDPRHGGDVSLAQLVDAHGKLPATWTAQTGGGGLHILFAWPEDLEVRNSSGKIAAGLDVRGTGGYMVLAPSSHASGNRYRWIHPPEETPLAPAPAWLLRLVEDAPRPRRNGGARVPAPMIPAGGRHDALISLLGLIKSWEACEEVGHAAADALATHQFLDDDPERPISMAHIHDQVRDVWRRY